MKQVLRCLVDIKFLMDFRGVRLAAGVDVDVWAELRKSRSLVAELVQVGLVEERDLTGLVRPRIAMLTAFELDEARESYVAVLVERSVKLTGTDIQRRILVSRLDRIAVLVTEVAFRSYSLPDALNYGPRSMSSRPGAGSDVTVASVDYLAKHEQRENELRNPEAVLAAAKKLAEESKATINRIKRRGQAARRATKRRSAQASVRSMRATAE